MKATGGISLALNVTGRTVQVGCLSKSPSFSLVLLPCGASAYSFENVSFASTRYYGKCKSLDIIYLLVNIFYLALLKIRILRDISKST